MLEDMRKTPKSLVLTSISVFAALNVLADMVPLTPFIGVPGASFRLGWVLPPLTGMLLGAGMGGISCLIAGIIEFLMGQQPSFGPFVPLRPAVSAFIAGLLASRNWQIPAASLSALIFVWLLLPVGREASIILVFHTTGFVLILVLRGRIGDMVESKKSKNSASGLFLTAYCGNISRHLLGNILSATILNLSSLVFVSALPLTLIEQSTFAVAAAVIGVSLNRLGIRELLHRI